MSRGGSHDTSSNHQHIKISRIATASEIPLEIWGIIDSVYWVLLNCLAVIVLWRDKSLYWACHFLWRKNMFNNNSLPQLTWLHSNTQMRLPGKLCMWEFLEGPVLPLQNNLAKDMKNFFKQTTPKCVWFSLLLHLVVTNFLIWFLANFTSRWESYCFLTGQKTLYVLCTLGMLRIVELFSDHQWQLTWMSGGSDKPKKTKRELGTCFFASRLVVSGLEGEIQRKISQKLKSLL